MKTWRIEGLDRQTGEPRTRVIDANTKDEAIRAVGDEGMVVSEASEVKTRHNPDRPARTPKKPAPTAMPTNAIAAHPGQQLVYVGPTVWRIAWGVFFGLLLWALVPIVLFMLLLVISMIFGFALSEL